MMRMHVDVVVIVFGFDAERWHRGNDKAGGDTFCWLSGLFVLGCSWMVFGKLFMTLNTKT